jgi:hypothetical protein
MTSRRPGAKAYRDWAPILDRAREIVESYNTPVTLRQLFYRLVAGQVIPNTTVTYQMLSARTAKARRDGTFPDLADLSREIHDPLSFRDLDDARGFMARIYRLDRTEGQPVTLVLGVEKSGMLAQLRAWFDDLGVPIVPLGGYASQTLAGSVRELVHDRDRPGVLIYAGDHDPEGHDILRDLVERTDCWAKVVRVALDADQCETFDLPPQPGKAGSPRAAGFIAEHGELVQVELDALPPDTMRDLYSDAIGEWWDDDAYRSVLGREDADRRELDPS